MPQLPLPAWAVIPAGGDLPVSTVADVLAVYPTELQGQDPAPVRDALLAGLTRLLLRHQELSGYAAAQSDPGRATDTYEDGLFDDRGVFRVRGEGDEPFRARGLAVPGQVTRADILAVVNTLLAPVTSTPAQVFEPSLDRLFISDGTAAWHSFIGASPQYQDRLLPDDLALNGFSRAQSDPGKTWVFGDAVGRHFFVRVPDIAGIDQNLQLVYSGALLAVTDALVPELGGATPAYTGTLLPGQVSPSAGGQGLFVADGSNASGSEADGTVTTFLFSNTTDSLTTYQAIVGAVERIRGHSIRWTLYVDSSL